MTKMTYVNALNTALTALSALDGFDPEVIARLTDLRDQTAKRNANPSKPTAAQVLNDTLKGKVLAVLNAEPATITQLMARDAELSALSNQKVSALANMLVDEGKAVKTVEKRKSYFTLA